MPATAQVPPFLAASFSAQLGEEAVSSLAVPAGARPASASAPPAPTFDVAGTTVVADIQSNVSSSPTTADSTTHGKDVRESKAQPLGQPAVSGSATSSDHVKLTRVSKGGLAAAAPVGATLDIWAAQALVVPPLNFDMVVPGVYRSGHPNERNFEFMRRLGLKSIMYLAAEDYRPHVVSWAEENKVKVLHHRISVNKEPFAEMEPDAVAAAMGDLLDRRNLPMLVHCNKGKYRVGVFAALVRKLQGWTLTSIYAEYERFAGQKITDEEFIDLFELSSIRCDPAYKPSWCAR
ncbi:protein tyrosine phosphatase [Ceraceosorus bombacis]|uniref:Protein tyrosine phosphatase n=1 Tax=Ceraceosorus bombacis TaxID=401625 RepID=A0A0P1BKS5_9BASI|nr:protein tyrosine phosphatase [Ceraceosorus bombacis]